MKRRQFVVNSATGILGAGIPKGIFDLFLLRNKTAKGISSCPNILWIMFDDCRYDALGCYGRSWPVTPHMDRMAVEGVRFDTAIVQNTVSIPSRRSMKTGYYSYEVGPMEMGRNPDVPCDYIDPRKRTLINNSPNLLDEWAKAGIKPVNQGKIHGFPDSFDDRGDPEALFDALGNPTSYFLEKIGTNSSINNIDRVFTKTHKWQIGGALNLRPENTETWRLGDQAVETINQLVQKEDRFFMRVSFHAPHVPCFVPKEYYINPSTINLPVPSQAELFNKPEFEKGPLRIYAGADITPDQIDLCRGTYYGMVSLVDVQVGRLLNALEMAGKLNNTIIAVTSDQGFQLGEHGLWKKRVFYEANVRVPLVIYYPERLPRGLTIFEPVEMIDFLPTLLELSGMEQPAGVRGVSLMPLINGEKSKWRKACFSEIDHSQSVYDELRKGTGRRVMVRTKVWKLDYFMDNRVKEKDGALYNLISDPDEKNNLYQDPGHNKIIKELEYLADEWNQGKNLFK